MSVDATQPFEALSRLWPRLSRNRRAALTHRIAMRLHGPLFADLAACAAEGPIPPGMPAATEFRADDPAALGRLGPPAWRCLFFSGVAALSDAPGVLAAAHAAAEAAEAAARDAADLDVVGPAARAARAAAGEAVDPEAFEDLVWDIETFALAPEGTEDAPALNAALTAAAADDLAALTAAFHGVVAEALMASAEDLMARPLWAGCGALGPDSASCEGLWSRNPAHLMRAAEARLRRGDAIWIDWFEGRLAGWRALDARERAWAQTPAALWDGPAETLAAALSEADGA